MADPDATGSSEGKSKSRWEEVSDLLKGKARLEKAARSVLAQNLGLMAKRLDPDHPERAAHRMFERAFEKTSAEAWSKRKRLVRLPGEKAPRFDRHGDYEAGGRNYVKLAEAYAEIRSPSSKDERDHAIRFLTRGTSFNPVRDSSPHDQEGVDRAIEELKNRLSDPAIKSKIVKCVSNSRYLPVRNDAGFVSIIRDSSDYKDGALINALSPRVKIGKIYVPMRSPVIRIFPASGDPIYLAEPYIEDSIDKSLVNLTDQNFSEAQIPSIIADHALQIYYNNQIAQRLEELNLPFDMFSLSRHWSELPEWFNENEKKCEYGVFPYVVYAEYTVSVFMICDENDELVEPAILVAHEDDSSFEHFVLRYRNEFIDFTSGPSIVDGYMDDDFQYRLIDVYGESIAVGDFASLADLRAETWPDIAGIYKLDDPATSDMLMNGSDGECFFEPTVWDDRNLFATAPQTSMVATILRNLAYAHANGADGLDDLIFADAEKRLNPVLKFYEDQRAAFDEAMDQRD